MVCRFGKTSAAKLAKLIAKSRKNIGLVSCDIYRPAARNNCKHLLRALKLLYDYAETAWARHAMKVPRIFTDVILIDTAGRVSIDNEMMDELKDYIN